jgi:pyruvate/2-oxoglutarate dehydrogenase complex dihydrolipoamide acyltransferase (E2) component
MIQDAGYTVDWGPAAMYFITDKLNSTDVGALQSAIARKTFVHDWKHLEASAKELSKRLKGKEAGSNSLTWKLLTTVKPDTILFTLATSKEAGTTRKIHDFLTKWREIKNRFPLPEMAPLRITPELPEYPKLVEDMFMLMLDNKLKSTEDITKYLQPYSPPEPEPPPAPPRKARAKKAVKKSAKAKAAEGSAAPAPAAQGDNKESAMPDLKEVGKAIGGTLGKVVAAVKSVAPGKSSAKKAPAKSAAKKAPTKKSAAKKASAKSASKKKGPAKATAAKKKK